MIIVKKTLIENYTKENTMATKKDRNIYSVILQARGMIGAVTKNATNPFFQSKYADINNVIDTINPVCESLGLVWTQSPKVTKENQDILYTRLTLEDNPEQFIESEVRLIMANPTPQVQGASITYARRYALISMLGLPTEDDDGNSASKKPTPTQKRNLEINKAMDKLVEAHKNKDLESATNIYEWAVDKDYVQVIDKHIQLFGE